MRGPGSRQKLGEMSDFCLPADPNPARTASKVEQNHPKLRKCSTVDSKIGPRGLESRQKLGEMSDFCLPSAPKSTRVASKVEQNPPKSEKCSTRLPSPKQCDLRLQANSKKNVLPVTEVRCSD